jgi:uncharacterized protein with HEPN domain
MVDAASRAVEWTRDAERERFETDLLLQSAVLHQIQILGEAASRIPLVEQEAMPSIPWREIVGFRNVVVHAYMSVDLDIVWEVVRRQLVDLLPTLEQILDGADASPSREER